VDASAAEQSHEVSLADGLAYAIQLHRAGQLDAAEAIYRRVLALAPDHPDALHFLGVLHHQRGASEIALDLIRRAIVVDPALPDRYINLGNVLAERGEWDAAAANYRQAVACNGSNAAVLANAWSNLGAVLRAQERYEEAAAAYEKAIAFAPEHADAYNNYANLLSTQGRIQDALHCYCKAVTLAPRHAQSRAMLGVAYYTLRQFDEAAAVYRAWLRDEPGHPVATHLLAACSGENVPMRASDAYIETTFDTFAQTFDAKLQRLDYHAPKLLADVVARVLKGRKSEHTLDAGCGTGLCGPLLKPHSKWLTGVDLSSGMLERAKTRASYDELIKVELTEFLATHPDRFDLIVSADTLVYFGDLHPVLRAAWVALRLGGILAFSVEAMSEEECAADYRINPHGRYSHCHGYVERLLLGLGYARVSIRQAVLRNEGGVAVAGLVVLGCKMMDGPANRGR
jgi:predicted TPR repeat methyltransferase